MNIPSFLKLNRVLLAGTFLLVSLPGQSQNFRYRASLDSVRASGFHRIILPPNVVGHLNDNLTDVRLYDSLNREIPYLLTRKQPEQTTSFVDYELVSRKIQPNVSTTIVVRQPIKTRIHSLGLVIKNTNVGKKARLSGSSDAQNWYAIDNAGWLGPTQANQQTTDTKLLYFPLSDYAYYQLEINDSLSDPLNILKVGNYTPVALAGTYSPIPDLIVSQRDSSDKHTYIHLTRTDYARFDKLTLLIQATMPYRRQALIGQFTSRRTRKGRVDNRFEAIRTLTLSSSDSNIVYLPDLRAKDLWVVIANDDNPPLVINDVRTYQLTTYLLANLTAGSAYQLRFSADAVEAPVYDLTPFQTNLPANPPTISVLDLVSTQTDGNNKGGFLTDSRLIWLALGLVLIILGFFSYRMIRDMGKSDA